MRQATGTELLETADVARLLQRTPAAIRAMVNRGRIPIAVTTPRGARLFRRADIDAIVKSMRTLKAGKLAAERACAGA
jgi:hypothetical protein